MPVTQLERTTQPASSREQSETVILDLVDPSQSASPTKATCKIMRGRRRGDTKWLVIQIGSDGSEHIVAFPSETEARMATSRMAVAGAGALDISETRSFLSDTDFILRIPAWRI